MLENIQMFSSSLQGFLRCFDIKVQFFLLESIIRKVEKRSCFKRVDPKFKLLDRLNILQRKLIWPLKQCIDEMQLMQIDASLLLQKLIVIVKSKQMGEVIVLE